MPTIASSVVPPPKSWDEFEDITLAAAKLRWGSDDFHRHGRSGQRQDGVDVYGLDNKNRQIGLQCKNTVDGVSFAVVKAEIDNAETFVPTLDHLYIFTTAKHDVLLQKQIRLLNDSRQKTGKFRVSVLFWDEICQDLARDDNIFFTYYPQFRGKIDEVREHDRALYKELTALLRSDGIIGFLDHNNMAGFSFLEVRFDPLRQFYYEWNQPEREFLVPEMEAIRRALWEKAHSYLNLLATETFQTHNPDWHSVPPEWEYEQPERFWQVVNKFHQLAGEIVALHADLIRTGKAQLIVGS